MNDSTFERHHDEFVAAWKRGETPRIETFLHLVPQAKQAELLHQLLQIELWWRDDVSDLDIVEYENRFRAFPGVVREALEQFRREFVEVDKAPEPISVESMNCPTAEPDDTLPASTSGIDRGVPGTLEPDSEERYLPSNSVGQCIRYFGEYELLEEIARGGMGVVFKARQSKLNRIVALKMILSGELAGEKEVKRFHAEAEAAANLDHPGIVSIYEIGEQNGQHYFSMAFVDGQSLQQKLRNGPLPPREAADLCRRIAKAVAYAHEQGVIHRDLKPGNILIDKSGEPRITDFGLAKQLQAGNELTRTGAILGTPAFMPPEQAEGKLNQIDQCSDIYSLGAVLYAALSGQPPFTGVTTTDLLMQVIYNEPRPIRQLNHQVERDLNNICMKCLEKEAKQRYASAQDLAKDLQRYLNRRPVHARPIGRAARTLRWCKRNKAMTFWIGAFATSLFYPLVLGIASLLAVAFTFPKLSSVENMGVTAGWATEMKILNEDGDLVTESVFVLPGIRSMKREDVEPFAEILCEEAVVLQFISGLDESNRFRTGGELRVWVELQHDAKTQTVFTNKFDMRVAPDHPMTHQVTVALLRSKRRDDGSETWHWHQTSDRTRITQASSDQRTLQSPIAKSSLSFRNSESKSSSDAMTLSGTVNVWSEPGNLTFETMVTLLDKRLRLPAEVTSKMHEAIIAYAETGNNSEKSELFDRPVFTRYSQKRCGVISNFGVEQTLYEFSGGRLLRWRSAAPFHAIQDQLPNTPGPADATIRIKCQLNELQELEAL